MQAAAEIFVAFEAKLTPEQISRGVNALINFLKHPYGWVSSSAREHLASLTHRLSPQLRAQAAMTLAKCRYSHLRILSRFVKFLENDVTDHVLSEAMAKHFDVLTAKSYEVSFAAIAMSNSRSIAKLLSHPGCIGEARECLLKRFEELIFHEGRHVFLVPENSDSDSDKSATQVVTSLKPETHARRFHTIYDAADWIKNNWPDFDLEATHPVTWRGEQEE